MPLAILVALVAAIVVSVALAVASGPGEPPATRADAAALPESGPVAPVVAPSATRTVAPPAIAVKTPPPPPPPASSPSRATGGSALGPSDYRAYCASPSTPYGAASVRGLMTAANRERARLGIAPLSWSSSLASAAQSWSRHMADTGSFAHGAGAGLAENIGWASYSEGYSEGTAAGVMHRSWMRSSGHCRNLMNPAYTQMGAGLASAGGGTTWYGTELFR